MIILFSLFNPTLEEKNSILHQEILPKWFDIAQIPYPEMWPDYQLWLAKILSGEKLHLEFLYDQEMQVES